MAKIAIPKEQLLLPLPLTREEIKKRKLEEIARKKKERWKRYWGHL